MNKERFKIIAAVHVLLYQEDHVLLLRRYNTGYEDGNYSVIAGHLDGNEQVIDAAIREAWEEAGIRIALTDLRVVGVLHRKSAEERVDFFVSTDRWQGDIVNMEPDKCDELRWFALAELPENLIPYVRIALQKDRNGGMWFDSYGFAEGEN